LRHLPSLPTRRSSDLASRDRNDLRPNDLRCPGRRAPLSATVAAFRTSARSSGPSHASGNGILQRRAAGDDAGTMNKVDRALHLRSEEHTSELQSLAYL